MSYSYRRDCDNPVDDTIEFLQWLHDNGITIEQAIGFLKFHCEGCKGCHATDLEIMKMESGK